jgi:hypothetical protein
MRGHAAAGLRNAMQPNPTDSVNLAVLLRVVRLVSGIAVRIVTGDPEVFRPFAAKAYR